MNATKKTLILLAIVTVLFVLSYCVQHSSSFPITPADTEQQADTRP